MNKCHDLICILQAGLMPRMFAYLFDRIREANSRQVGACIMPLPFNFVSHVHMDILLLRMFMCSAG